MTNKLRELVDNLKFAVDLDAIKSLIVEESQMIIDAFDVPEHETVQQWEERKGEVYPDDGPVWDRYKDSYVLCRCDHAGGKWSIVADYHGEPNEDKLNTRLEVKHGTIQSAVKIMESMLGISDLWLPNIAEVEHEEEVKTLHKMRDTMLKFISNHHGKPDNKDNS